MTNLYEVLSISKDANSAEIKGAYKKLALKYHPDINQNDKSAEEKFKQINEAYQTLSDPVKKNRYDYILTYGFEPPAPERPVYNAQTYYRAEKVRPAPRKLSFLYIYIFIGFALFILLGFYFFSYMEKKAARSILADAERLYEEGNNPKAALDYLQLALEKDETLAPAYFLSGKILYNEAGDYASSLYYFDNAVLEGNGIEDSIGSYYYWRGKNRLKLEDYILGISDLEAAYAYLPNNIPLILMIADTYLYKLQQYDEALFYYEQVLLSNPQHFEALLGKGVTLQKKIAYADAAVYLENAANLKPQAGEVYYYLAIQALNYENDTTGACDYWRKASNMGVKEALVQSEIYCQALTSVDQK